MKLADRVALVFGAGSVGPGWGNGKASAVAYARAGAKVVAVDWNSDAAKETAAIIASEGGTALALTCDVTKEADITAAIAATVAKFGAVDILHNNVGSARIAGTDELTDEDWRRQLDLNLGGVFLATKHTLPLMLKAGRGVITNISSIAAIRYTGYDYPAYYAAKAAINQFTTAIALKHARDGVRANAIMPGLMDTPHIYQHITVAYGSADEMAEKRHAAAPMGRMGTGWDVAHAAVFLASDEAQYITAVCLPVDGGISARMM